MKKKDIELSILIGILVYILFILPYTGKVHNLVGLVQMGSPLTAPGGISEQPPSTQPPSRPTGQPLLAPAIGGVNLLPPNPTTLSPLVCRFSAVNILEFIGHQLSANITIFNGTVPLNSTMVNVTNGTNHSVMFFNPHKKGEMWRCSARPYVAGGYGSIKYSNFVTIVNLPPSQVQPLLSTVSGQSVHDNIICQDNVYDPDGDPVNKVYSYYVNTLPLHALYLAMEANDTNQTKDYGGDNQTVQSFNGAHPINTGVQGKGFGFDGVDDYLRILDQEDLEFDSTESFTIELWIRTTGYQKKVVLSKYFGLGSYYILYIENGKVFFEMSNGTTIKTINNSNSSSVVNDNSYHHIAILINRYLGNSKIYIDGLLTSNSVFDLRGNIGVNNANLYIGGLILSTPGAILLGCNCNIDEVMIYNYPIAPDQVAIHSSGVYNLIAKYETFNNEQWKCRVFIHDDQSEGLFADSNILITTESGGPNASQPAVPGQQGGSSLPGGTPSGPGTSGWTGGSGNIEYIFDLRTDNVKTFNLLRQDRILVKGLALDYILSLSDIYPSYAIFNVNPGSDRINLATGENINADLDNDGNFDIILSATNFGNNQISLTIRKFSSQTVQAQTSPQAEQPTPQETSKEESEFKEELKKKINNKLIFAAALIFAIIVILIILWNKMTPY